MLFGLQPGLVHGLLQLALPDDNQGRLPGVDDVPELLDIGAGHATPQVAADPAHRGAHHGGADDRGREQDADQGTDGSAAPRAVPGGHLILVHVHLACVVLGDHRRVVGADRASRVQVLDDVVVGLRRRLARVSADVDKDCIRLRHVVSPVLARQPVQPGALRPVAAHHPAGSHPGRRPVTTCRPNSPRGNPPPQQTQPTPRGRTQRVTKVAISRVRSSGGLAGHPPLTVPSTNRKPHSHSRTARGPGL